jgi:hypothetical protein
MEESEEGNEIRKEMWETGIVVEFQRLFPVL